MQVLFLLGKELLKTFDCRYKALVHLRFKNMNSSSRFVLFVFETLVAVWRRVFTRKPHFYTMKNSEKVWTLRSRGIIRGAK
mmetsp:Transcript_20678/g.57123  ORF Transcript_20678/g.57123 Transcript_20678/m.57123 type:complete len:81 (-) Transcript_20678:1246-1488(-)